MSTHKAVDLKSIYFPVSDALEQVDLTIREASRVEGFDTLQEVLAYILTWSGKHIRPALTLMSSRFYPTKSEAAIVMAAAIEMLHVATLVHDDTVDAADKRRGRATVSSIWGKEVAVLVGDYVFAKAASVACDTADLRGVRLFADTVMALSSGELREFVSSKGWEQSRDLYWKRIEEKTASLFATAAAAGAMLSGAPSAQVLALRTYGHNLGMAFQIVDDILDFSSTEVSIGKPVGNDFCQGIATLPAILLAEREPEGATLRAAFDSGDPARLRASVDMVRGSSAIEQAFLIAERFCATARDTLKELPAIPERDSLEELTYYVTQRDK